MSVSSDLSYLERVSLKAAKPPPAALEAALLDAKKKEALCKGTEMFKAWKERKAAREASRTPTPAPATPPPPPSSSVAGRIHSTTNGPMPTTLRMPSASPSPSPAPVSVAKAVSGPFASAGQSPSPAPQPLTAANVAAFSRLTPSPSPVPAQSAFDKYTGSGPYDDDDDGSNSSLSSTEALEWISRPASRAPSTQRERPANTVAAVQEVSASQGRPGYVKQVQQMLATNESAAAAPPSAARGPRSGSGGHAAPSRPRARDAPAAAAPAPPPAATGPAPSKSDHSLESERLLKAELAKVREEMARMAAHMTAMTQVGAKAMAQLPRLVQQQVRAASRSKSRGRSRNNSRTTSPAPPTRGREQHKGGLEGLGRTAMAPMAVNVPLSVAVAVHGPSEPASPAAAAKAPSSARGGVSGVVRGQGQEAQGWRGAGAAAPPTGPVAAAATHVAPRNGSVTGSGRGQGANAANLRSKLLEGFL